MRLWRNGRRAGFRFQWATVEVQVLSAAPEKISALFACFRALPEKLRSDAGNFLLAAKRKSHLRWRFCRDLKVGALKNITKSP